MKGSGNLSFTDAPHNLFCATSLPSFQGFSEGSSVQKMVCGRSTGHLFCQNGLQKGKRLDQVSLATFPSTIDEKRKTFVFPRLPFNFNTIYIMYDLHDPSSSSVSGVYSNCASYSAVAMYVS